MAGLPPDSRYVTAEVPPEMRVGADLGPAEVAPPTAAIDLDGQAVQITRIRVPRPDHIPAGAPKLAPLPDAPPQQPRLDSAPIQGLQYDFPLLPGVQCRIILQGTVTADHLEQLCSYLTVAVNKVREQEGRKREPRTSLREADALRDGPGPQPARQRKRNPQTNAEGAG